MNDNQSKSAESKNCAVCHKQRSLAKRYCIILCYTCYAKIRNYLLSNDSLRCSTGRNNCVTNWASPHCSKCFTKKCLEKGVNILCIKISTSCDLTLRKSCSTKSLRYPDDLIRRLLNGEFSAVRSELAKLFQSKGMLTILSSVETTQSTSSSSANNLDSNPTSTSLSSFQSLAESFYLNETIETIEICSTELQPARPVTDSDSDELIDVIN